MEAMSAILSRRSIRKYTHKPIPEGLISELLKAAMSAPSAHNEQPWHFIILQDHAILNEIPALHPNSMMLKEAPAAIVVCADLQLAGGMAWWVQDCSAATENILIAANANSLGAVWLGVYPVPDRVAGVQKLLGLPQNIIPFCIVSLGYPIENKPPANRYDATRVHQTRW